MGDFEIVIKTIRDYQRKIRGKDDASYL